MGRPDKVRMSAVSLLALFVAISAPGALRDGGTGQTNLGVSATVVRPIEITAPAGALGRPTIVIRNVMGVVVTAVGATAKEAGHNAILAKGDGAAIITITLTY